MTELAGRAMPVFARLASGIEAVGAGALAKHLVPVMARDGAFLDLSDPAEQTDDVDRPVIVVLTGGFVTSVSVPSGDTEARD